MTHQARARALVRRVGQAPAVVLLAMAGLLPACFLFDARTHVEQGQLYTAGSAEYDEFFVAVHALHEDAARAEDDEVQARALLAKALHLSEKASADVELRAAKEGAEKLGHSGVLLHLQLTPETKLLSTHGAAPLGADGEAMVKGVDASARSCIDLSQRLGTFGEKLASLEKKREALRVRADAELHQMPPVKRQEITRELDASKDAMARDVEKIALHAGAASTFVLDLARAVETGAKPFPAASPEATGKPAKTPRPGSATRPASGGAPPPPPPRRKPGGDDFEP